MSGKKKKRTLKREITLLTMATSFGALVLFGTVMIVMFFVFFLGNIREDMENILQNTLQNYQAKMQFIQDGAVMIRHNSILRDFFDADWTDRAEMEKQLSYSMELFSNRNMTEGQSPFVTSVCLFNKKDEYVREHYYPMTVSAGRNKEIGYLEMMRDFRQTEERYRMTSGADEINLCFRVYGDGMEELGICVLGIAKEGIQDIFAQIETYSHGSWGISDQKRNIMIFQGEKQTAEELSRLGMNAKGEKRIAGNRTLYASMGTGFGTCAAVSVGMDNIYVILKPTMVTFFAVIFLALIFIGAMMLGISFRFTRPLKTLADNLQAFGKKDLDVRMEDSSISEIHEISVIFNEMAERIQYLIEQVYEKKLLAARSQTKYLQAQINPHFQFNILAMFSIRARLAGDEELYKGLQAFSGLMRGKIFREKEIRIPVSEEMELVDFYLYLQKSRFEDQLSYEIEYGSEDVKNFRIPRLLIENLVENAVSHGIEPKSGEGIVQIHLFEENDMLHIVVEDNGVGYEEQEEDLEMDLEEETEHTHTGLANMKRLLEILYHDRYCMKITGEKNVGTRAEIILPAERGSVYVESSSSR